MYLYTLVNPPYKLLHTQKKKVEFCCSVLLSTRVLRMFVLDEDTVTQSDTKTSSVLVFVSVRIQKNPSIFVSGLRTVRLL